MPLQNASAGIEPEPFQPEINQLGALENILVSANSRINMAIENPPDPFTPSPDVNGAVNRMEAINNQLVSVDDMVRSMLVQYSNEAPGSNIRFS